MSEIYVSKVEKVGDEYTMLFQPELLKRLNLKEDEILSWKFIDDETITIKKTNARSQ